MAKKTLWHDWIWIAPLGLGLAALLSLLDRGTWWIGWLAYACILVPGLFASTVLWRRAGASRTLGLSMLLALCLRLSLGVAMTYVLPAYGYESKVQNAGYLFADAYTRDTQAWTLASSSDPIWKAFDKSYSTDQYGGFLAMSALIYRYLSPDAHRPWLLVLCGALTVAIGVALAWKAAQRLWGDSVARPAAWILALYPESILQGSSQMREPFLITLIAMAFWGLVDWQSHHPRAWFWLAAGFAGMLLFSPGVAAFALFGMAGWSWLQSRGRRASWRTILIGAGMAAVALVLLWLGLARGPFANASPATVFSKWLQWSSRWDIYVLERSSGVIQWVFDVLPQPLHMPFMTGYGITQPLLPAILLDTAPWPWKVIGILRSVGWYILVPFLAASLLAVWNIPDKRERRAWIWLWVISWAWILLSSFRAGGDLWDNPRYRVIFLLWQAFLAAKAWRWWRETHSPWMGRILAVEAVFLVFFSVWYSSRYGTWANQPLHVFIIIAAVTLVSGLILAGGWIWDRRRGHP